MWKEDSEVLRNTNDKDPYRILSSLQQPITYAANDDVDGKDWTTLSLPFSPSLHISELKTEPVGRTVCNKK